MTNEVTIRCQKTPEVGIRRVPPYTPNTPWNRSKIWGAWARFGGPVPPSPSLKPPLQSSSRSRFLWRNETHPRQKCVKLRHYAVTLLVDSWLDLPQGRSIVDSSVLGQQSRKYCTACAQNNTKPFRLIR